MEEITITTKDGIDLSALLWDNGSAQSMLLLHMMPATKESWLELAEKLSIAGLNVLALDFRGHGKSGGGDYKMFKPEEHYGYLEDAKAAGEFLESKYPDGIIFPGGASIGANLALGYMAEHLTTASKGFALSAGLDYHGVRAIDFVAKLDAGQEVLFVGSRDDQQGDTDCGAMAEQLAEAATSKTQKIIYDTGGHGTSMFAAHPELVEQITKFLI